jgi:lipoprotein-releasing system permease protein
MLLSVFISYGFQNQIRTKVIGFGSHIRVTPYANNTEVSDDWMPIDQDFYKNHKQYKQISSMQPVAYKPGIIQRVRKNTQGNRELQGVLFKGINKDYDKKFLKDNLKEGKLIQFGSEPSRDMLISRKIANNLSVGVGDTIASVLISKKAHFSVSPEFRKFRVCGIYETGLEEFDNEYAFIDMAHIQRANGWGINAVLDVNDTLKEGKIEVLPGAVTTSGKIDWHINGHPYNGVLLHLPTTPGKYEIIASDNAKKLISDTVYLNVSPSKVVVVSENANDSYVKAVRDENEAVSVQVSSLEGSARFYTGVFEINLKNWNDLKSTDDWLRKLIGPTFGTKTIIEEQQQIFNWLDLVDLNVTIIIVLMLVVAIINLVSAILVLILERSKMIGLLKSMGAENRTVGYIFLYFTINILVRGLIIGNVLVLIIFFIQNYTGIIQLNPETYFVSTVPMEFDWIGFIFVNALTMVVCMLAFFLPVLLVTRIDPVKAIKIE